MSLFSFYCFNHFVINDLGDFFIFKYKIKNMYTKIHILIYILYEGVKFGIVFVYYINIKNDFLKYYKEYVMKNNDVKDDVKRINRLVSIPPKYYSDIEEIANEHNLTILKAGRLCMLIGIHLFAEYKAMFEEFRKNKNLDKII